MMLRSKSSRALFNPATKVQLAKYQLVSTITSRDQHLARRRRTFMDY
jgi:hypothetical protein